MKRLWWTVVVVGACAKGADSGGASSYDDATCADYCAEYFSNCNAEAVADYNDPLNCESTCEGSFAQNDAADDSDHGTDQGDSLECRHTWGERAATDPSACENAAKDGGSACVAPASGG